MVVASDLFRGELLLFDGDNVGRIDVVVLSGEVSVESSLLIKLSLEVFEAKSPTSCNNDKQLINKSCNKRQGVD